ELASITVPDAGLVYLRQMQSLIDQIDRMMEEMKAEAERQGQTIDPATQWTLDRLRQTLEEQLTQTREVLNARGLFHSGILLELENQLREGMMSEEARILAERLNRIQSQLLDGLNQLRERRIAVAQEFGALAAQAQTEAYNQAMQRRQDLIRQIAERRAQLASMAQDFEMQRRDQAFRREEAALQRQFDLELERMRQALDLEIEQMRQARSSAGGGGSNLRYSQSNTDIIINELRKFPDRESA